MRTRSLNNIYKPKKFFDAHATKHPIPMSVEPCSVKVAFQQPIWKQAMEDEYEALCRNKTWHLVEPPPDPTSCWLQVGLQI